MVEEQWGGAPGAGDTGGSGWAIPGQDGKREVHMESLCRPWLCPAGG